jgi:hypothetical protein
VFGQAPGQVTALGIALICLAGLGVALTEARLAWRRTQALRERG